MKNNLRRTLAMLLIIVMMTSGISFGQGAQDLESINVDLSGFSLVRNEGVKLSEDLLNLDNDEKEVRIIVELKTTPVIESATAQGVMLKDMNNSVVESLVDQIEAEQEVALSAINSKVSVEVHETFNTVFNGFSMTVKSEDLNKIANLDNVKRVFRANEYARPETMPNMDQSSQLTNASFANEELGYNGEGLVVAIIDTGIDPNHKDMFLDGSKVEGELTQAEINQIVTLENLPGQYFTAKVPYGYNYMDKDSKIRDLGAEASMHGMHVSGIVAADGELKGVAPKAQLLAMKVFGNDPEFPSTFGDVIIKAIDDSILLGADVMNLSLGSTAAFVDAEDPEQQAITRATDNGIVMAISAGNSAYMGNGAGNPLISNPDIGVVGSPGLVAESLQVASVDNFNSLYVNNISYGDVTIEGFGKDGIEGTYDLVAIGGDKMGTPDNYEGIDVTGKFVLVSRGALSFYDKNENAMNAGAIGIIVYDHGLGQFYYDQGGWFDATPFTKISKEDGLALEELLLTQDAVEINVSIKEAYANPTSGKLSSFSSWGTTPDLSFKPDISAPGGSIKSTLNDNQYGIMSGTSMAAPHAAGGSALVVERINEDLMFNGLNLTERQKVELAKNLLMNTAVPVEDFELATDGFVSYTSPRRQGAGSMDLKLALTTSTVVVDPTTGLAKVNLGEIGNQSSFSLEITNYSTIDALYEVSEHIQYQHAQGDTNALVSVPVINVQPLIKVNGLVVEGPIKVSAGQSVVVDFSMDLTGAKDILGRNIAEIFPNGNFVEAFVFFEKSDAHLNDANVIYQEAKDFAKENDDLILELTEAMDQYVLDLEAKALEIEAAELLVTEQEALVEEKTLEMEAFNASNTDVALLMSQLAEAQDNLLNARNAFDGSKEALVLLASQYSVTTIIQGNYDFIEELFNLLDEMEEINASISNDIRVELKRKIIEVTSTLTEYEAVVKSLTVDESFLDLTPQERNELFAVLKNKVTNLRNDLESLQDFIERSGLDLLKIDLQDLIAKKNTRINTLKDKIVTLNEELAALNEALALLEDETEIADKKLEIEAKELLISEKKEKLSDVRIMRNQMVDMLTEVNIILDLAAEIQEANALNNGILEALVNIKEVALVVDNADEALKLLEATLEGKDLTAYEAHLEALALVKAELLALEEAVAELKASEEALIAIDLKAKEDIIIAINQKEGLDEAVALALAIVRTEEAIYENSVDLSVPVIGFYGNWSDAPMFDVPRHSEGSLYDIHGLVEVSDDGMYLMSEVSAFSPNGDGVKDSVIPYVTALRNLYDFKVEVVTEDGNVIRRLGSADGMRKNYFDNNPKNPQANFLGDLEFDGRANNVLLDDGQYYIRYSGVLTNGDAQHQDIPLMLDNTAPVVQTHSYNFDEKIFSARGTDNLSGIEEYILFELDFVGDSLSIVGVLDRNATGDFDLAALDVDPLFVGFAISDFAGNMVLTEGAIQLMDGQVPDVKLNVAPFEVQTANEFTLVGTVTDMLPNVKVKVDGEVVAVEDVDGVLTFTKEMAYENDGKTGIKIDATDFVGNTVSFMRWFFIDSTPATLELVEGQRTFDKNWVNYLEYGNDVINAQILAADNFPYLRVLVNGNEVLKYEDDFVSYENKLVAVEKAIDQTLNLQPGMNVFKIIVEDAAGTKTAVDYELYLLGADDTTPVATSILIEGNNELTNLYSEGSEAQYTATVLDQYGNPIAYDGEIAWTVETADEELVAQIEDGKLTIAPYAFDKTSELMIIATSGEGSEEITGNFTVNVQVPLFIHGIGFDGMEGFEHNAELDRFVNTLEIDEVYTSDVSFFFLDQYLNDMEVEYTVSLENDFVTLVDGVLTVPADFEGVFALNVEYADDSMEFEFEVVRPLYLKTISVEGKTTLQAVNGNNVTETYTAVLSDQHGDAFEADVVWTVEGSNVIMTNGVLTVGPNASGLVKVIATSGDVSGELSITVTPFAVAPAPAPTPAPAPAAPAAVVINVNLNVNNVELEVGTEAVVNTFDLNATVTGTNDNNVVWNSSNADVATVDANGLVTAVGVGTATITASREAGTEQATATVEVFLVGDEESPLGAVEFTEAYMDGYGDGTFKPEAMITRAQLAKIYVNILGLEMVTDVEQSFGDVSKDHWSFGYVEALKEAGIIKGYEDGNFKPDQALKLSELAQTFTNYWAYLGLEVSDKAVDGLNLSNHWAASSIYRLFNANVVKEGMIEIQPEEFVSRGKIVLMMNSLLGRASLEVESSKFDDVTDADLMGAIEAATTATLKDEK